MTATHAHRRHLLPLSKAEHQTAARRRPRCAGDEGANCMMNPFLWLIHTLIWLYIYILIAAAVLSWLIAFNVVNSHNPPSRMIWRFHLPDHGAGIAADPRAASGPWRHRHFAVDPDHRSHVSRPAYLLALCLLVRLMKARALPWLCICAPPGKRDHPVRAAFAARPAHERHGSSTARPIAADLRGQVADAVHRLARDRGIVPGLAVVLVGNNPASEVYVGSKPKLTAGSGMRSFDHRLPDTASEAELLALIDRLNADPAVHGILVQLPLPEQIDAQKVHRRHRSRQGCRRLPSGECRPALRRPAGAGALHAARLRAPGQDSASVRCRARGRRDRPLQHRRQAAGAASACGERHGHRRAFQDARPAGGVPARRYFVRRGRPAEMVRRRLGQAGRDRDRCRHQPRDGRGRQVAHRRRCRASRKPPRSRAQSRRCRAASAR